MNKKPLIETFAYSFKEQFTTSIGHVRGKNGVVGIGRIEGAFQEAEVVNRNRRKYPYDVLWGAIKRDLLPLIEERNLGGALDHYDGQVQLSTASHAITYLGESPSNKNIVWGEAVLLPTPSGEVAASLYRSNFRVGISARGLGSVVNFYEKYDGEDIQVEVVQPDYMLITYDLVSTPSHPNAMPQLVEALKLIELMQQGKYKEAKQENSNLTKQIADIVYDVLDISDKVKKSDDFQKCSILL